MGRYTGPVCKLCRREGQKLFLKGTRCYTEKCAIERRGYPPPGKPPHDLLLRHIEDDHLVELRPAPCQQILQPPRLGYGTREAVEDRPPPDTRPRPRPL